VAPWSSAHDTQPGFDPKPQCRSGRWRRATCLHGPVRARRCRSGALRLRRRDRRDPDSKNDRRARPHRVVRIRRAMPRKNDIRKILSPTSMHLLPLRRRLSLQPLDRVQDPVPRLGAGHVAQRKTPPQTRGGKESRHDFPGWATCLTYNCRVIRQILFVSL
jgi:hypothetical protein